MFIAKLDYFRARPHFQFFQQVRPEFFFQSSIEAKLMSEAAGAEFAKRPRQPEILHGECGRIQSQV